MHTELCPPNPKLFDMAPVTSSSTFPLPQVSMSMASSQSLMHDSRRVFHVFVVWLTGKDKSNPQHSRNLILAQRNRGQDGFVFL